MTNYIELAKVEFAFRTMKTTLEEIRPIFVHKQERTRGHAFVAILAFIIVKYI
jgi:transposase